MTHRQFRVWKAWLDEEWNLPNRSDYYAAQIAAVVVNSFSTENRTPVTINQCLMKFKQGATSMNDQQLKQRQDQQFKDLAERGFSVPRRLTKEDLARTHQWLNMIAVGVKPTPKPPPKSPGTGGGR